MLNLLSHRTETLQLTRKRVLALFVVATTTLIGCYHEARSDVYRESDGRVAEFTVAVSDPCLRVAVFVKRKGGDIQYPYVYYLQGHFTPTGFKDVEKPARTFTTVAPSKGLLHLPLADDIAEYLFLVSKPLLDESGPSERESKSTSWSELELFHVAADDELLQNRVVALPSFTEIEKLSASDVRDRRKLREMYEKGAAEAANRAATPIKHGDEVPAYAR